jgi:hypothetical protein
VNGLNLKIAPDLGSGTFYSYIDGKTFWKSKFDIVKVHLIFRTNKIKPEWKQQLLHKLLEVGISYSFLMLTNYPGAIETYDYSFATLSPQSKLQR